MCGVEWGAAAGRAQVPMLRHGAGRGRDRPNSTTAHPNRREATGGTSKSLGREPVHARSDTHTTSSPLGQSLHGELTETLSRGDGGAQSSGHSKTLLLTGASSDPAASAVCLPCDLFLLEEEKSSLGLCVCVIPGTAAAQK